MYTSPFQGIMNITSESSPCTFLRPQCLTEAPGNYSPPRTKFKLLQPWCNNGALYQSLDYRYERCKLDHIDQYVINRKLVCHCLNDVFHDCVPFSSYGKCMMIFGSILSVQLLMIITGVILNSIILTNFCRRGAMRKKIPNILLANQAVADLFNAGVFGVQLVVNQLILIIEKEDFMAATIISNAAGTITVSSSIFLYTIIAIERYLSIYFPLWSRVHVNKRHILASVMIAWLLSFVLGVCLGLRGVFPMLRILYLLLYILMASLAVLITILFISTFIKAYISLRSHLNIKSYSTNSISQGRHYQSKKKLHLTAVFFVMFMVFLIVYFPLSIVLSPGSKSSLALYEVILTLLLCTSLLNPALTMIFQKQFRLLQPLPQTNSRVGSKNNKSNNIKMKQVGSII